MNRILPSLIRPRTLLVIREGIPVADYHEDEITREPAGESVKNAIYDFYLEQERVFSALCVAPSWTFPSYRKNHFSKTQFHRWLNRIWNQEKKGSLHSGEAVLHWNLMEDTGSTEYCCHCIVNCIVTFWKLFNGLRSAIFAKTQCVHHIHVRGNPCIVTSCQNFFSL